MFKAGEKIICIDDTFEYFIWKYNVYTFISYEGEDTDYIDADYVVLEELPNYKYNRYKFISLREYRKRKLEKLKDV